MSSGPFEAFSERGPALAGTEATERVVALLREYRRGHRFNRERLMLELEIDEDSFDDLLELARDPDVDLLDQLIEVRCPGCPEWHDLTEMLDAAEEDGFATCEECNSRIEAPEQLDQRVRYELTEAADREAERFQDERPLKPALRCVILCALVEELTEVRKQMARHSDVGEEVTADGAIFLTSEFEGRHVRWTLAGAYTDQTNNNAAVSATTAAISFKPHVALFVGIAGGFPGEVERGDVVAATIVHEYEVGKESKDGYIPRVLQHKGGFALDQRAGHVRMAEEWQARIIPAVEELAASRQPEAHTDPIAAGSKVVANPKSVTARQIERDADRAVAVEMEGAGFLAAIYRFPKTDGLVIRGISDLMSNKRQGDRQGWQRQASANAAAFAFELLDTFVPAPD